MNRIRKILVATDFSPASRNALDHARTLAKRLDAEVHVLGVHVEQGTLHGLADFPNLDDIEKQLEARVRANMRDFLADCNEELVSAVISDEDETNAILRYVEKRDIDLIAMGTHGRSAATRFFLGSVAAEILRRAPVPVLVSGAGHAAGTDMTGRMLVPLDFSDVSLDLLRQAAGLAAALDGAIDVIHVTDPQSLPQYYARTFGEEQQRMAEQALQKLMAAASLDIEYTTAVLTGKPDDVIVDLAAARKHDLIMLASAGRSRLSQMLLGSTADRVIRKAPCPVLAWRAGE